MLAAYTTCRRGLWLINSAQQHVNNAALSFALEVTGFSFIPPLLSNRGLKDRTITER